MEDIEVSFGKKVVIWVFMCAFSFVCVYFSSLIGLNGKLTLLTLSSIGLCVIVFECEKPAAVLAYMVLAMLSVIFIESITSLVLYISIFAIYPIIKSMIEKKPARVTVIVMKMCTFAALVFLTVCLMKVYNFKAYLYVFAVIAGLVYDQLLTMFINTYAYYRLKANGIDPFAEKAEEDDEY